MNNLSTTPKPNATYQVSQGHRSTDSEEEAFYKFFPYMGMAAMLAMWPGPFEQLFWGTEKSFESVDGRRPTIELAYPVSSPGVFGLGELKHRTTGAVARLGLFIFSTQGYAIPRKTVFFNRIMNLSKNFISANLINFSLQKESH